MSDYFPKNIYIPTPNSTVQTGDLTDYAKKSYVNVSLSGKANLSGNASFQSETIDCNSLYINGERANSRGPTGAQGIQGNIGATGAQGIQGPTGSFNSTNTTITNAIISNLTGTNIQALNLRLSNTTLTGSSTTGTLSLPSSTDTLIARNTADTLTNKTLRDTTNNISANSLRNGTGFIDLSTTLPTSGQVLSFNGTGASWGNTTLLGDVTGTTNSNVVATVGGRTSTQISTSVGDTIAATSNNTVNTIVRRDPSGNVFINNLRLNNTTLTGSATTGTLTLPNSTDTLIARNTADTLTNKTLRDVNNSIAADDLRFGNNFIDMGTTAPTTGQVLTFNGSVATWGTVSGGTGTISSLAMSGDVGGNTLNNVVNIVGGRTATQISTSVGDTISATSLNTSNTIVRRDVAGSFSANTGAFNSLIVANNVSMASNTINISSFNGGNVAGWIDLSTVGASGIGSGGAGTNAWVGYASATGQWMTNSIAGDICYRNTSGRLQYGTSSGNSQMTLATTGLVISTPTSINNATVSSLTGTNGIITSLSSTNFTGTNEFISNSRISSLTGTNTFLQNANIVSLTGTNAVISALSTTNFTGTNIGVVSLTGTNIGVFRVGVGTVAGGRAINQTAPTGSLGVDGSLILNNTIINGNSITGTLTLPTSTDTLIGRTTVDTLTNKTLRNTNNDISANSLRNGTGFIDLSTTLPTTGQILTFNGTGASWSSFVGTGTSNINSINTNTLTIQQDNTINSANPNGMRLTNCHFSVPTSLTTLNCVDFYTSTINTDGSASFVIHVSLNGGGLSISKQYNFNCYYNFSYYNGAVWFKMNPIRQAIEPTTSQDFEILFRMLNGVLTFRLRKTSGTSAGIAYITVQQYGSMNNSLNTTTALATDTATYTSDISQDTFYQQLYSRNVTVGDNSGDITKDSFGLFCGEDSRAGSLCAMSDKVIASFKPKTYNSGNTAVVIWSPFGSGSTRMTSYVPIFSNSDINLTSAATLNMNGSLINAPNYIIEVRGTLGLATDADAQNKGLFFNFLQGTIVKNTFPSSGILFDGSSSPISGYFSGFQNMLGKSVLFRVEYSFFTSNNNRIRTSYTKDSNISTQVFLGEDTAGIVSKSFEVLLSSSSICNFIVNISNITGNLTTTLSNFRIMIRAITQMD